jgi:hypothetical protein
MVSVIEWTSNWRPAWDVSDNGVTLSKRAGKSSWIFKIHLSWKRTLQ